MALKALNLGTMLTGTRAGTPPEMQTPRAAAGKAGGGGGWGGLGGLGGAVSQEAIASLHRGQQGSPFLGMGSYRLWRVRPNHLTAP